MSQNDQPGQDPPLPAFEAVVSAYEAPLLRYAARIAGSPEAAQDVVQDTFLRLFRSWRDEMAPSPQLSAWLYRVAHNCAVSAIRRDSRRSALLARHAAEQAESLPPGPGPAGLEGEEAGERARAALQALSLRERQLVILKVYEEKSYREIGEITGLTVTNVGYILHHAMRKMAEALKGKACTP
jgi:RNA polymerase sigma factor (sigma-70 family)